MKYLWYCFILIFLFIISCQTEKKETKNKSPNPYESALPHGKSLPDTELSVADQKKLQTAIGREASILSMDQMQWMLDSLSGQLNVLNFWSLDCKSCTNNNRLLEQVQAEMGEAKFQIQHINLDDLENLPQINASIRAQGLANSCSILETDSVYNWSSQIQGNWNGELPAILLVNQEEGIRLFYQKTFSQEELMALLQPFTL